MPLSAWHRAQAEKALQLLKGTGDMETTVREAAAAKAKVEKLTARLKEVTNCFPLCFNYQAQALGFESSIRCTDLIACRLHGRYIDIHAPLRSAAAFPGRPMAKKIVNLW